MSLFGSGSLFGAGGTAAAQQQQQKPQQQQQTGGLFGSTAAGTGGGGSSLLFGQPAASFAPALGSRPAGGLSLFPSSSSSGGLFQSSSLFGGAGGTSTTGAAAGAPAAAGTSSSTGGAAAPFSSLFGGTTPAGGVGSALSLGAPAGLTTAATPAAAGAGAAAGLSGQPSTTTAGGGLLGSFPATATAGGGLLGMLPTTAAAGLPTAAAAGGGLAPGGAAPGVVGLLPLHQQQYLATVDARVQRIESMLADETASMATFMYQYDAKDSSTSDPTAAAATMGGGAARLTPQQHNEAMEAQLQQQLLLRPSDEGVRLLWRKWKKAKEENPDPTRCKIVLMQGTKQLAERVAAAAQLTQLLLKTLETVGNNTDQLLSKNQQLRQKLELVRERHRLLGHEFIRILHLIEHVALERGVCERNVRCEKANARILAALSAAFPWEEWQRRVDLLRVWTAALDRSAAAVSLREGGAAGLLTSAAEVAKGSGPLVANGAAKTWLTQLQEAAEEDELRDVARVLAAQGEAIEELNLSLAYTEQQTELLEDATVRKIEEKGQDEAHSAAAGGGPADVPGLPKKSLL